MFRTVVVSGANRGLGRELMQTLLRQGDRVVALTREALAISDEFNAENLLVIQADVTDGTQLEEAARLTKATWGTVDAIVNNAGAVFDDSESEAFELPEIEAMKRSIDVHLYGSYLVCRNFVPLFPQKKRADIVQVSSRMGQLNGEIVLPNKRLLGYRISKTSQNALTRHLAATFRGSTVFVNSVCPGWCRTDMGGPEAYFDAREGIETILMILNQTPDVSGRFWARGMLVEF